jgi:hypothetical protein
LSRLYRGKFLAYLAEAARAGALQFAGATAPLASASGLDAFLREQRAKEWVVYAKPPFGSPEHVLKYLARYTHRVAISDRRILAIQNDTVTFSYRDNARGGHRVMRLDGVEFLRRFLLHVLPTGFVRIRYFGLLANRGRALNLARCRELLATTAPGAVAPSTPSSPSTPTPPEDTRYRCPSCATGRLLKVATLVPAPAPDLDAWAPIPRDTS